MFQTRFLSAALLCAAIALTPAAGGAADKAINITGNGPDAQYVEKGKAKQLNVVIRVGDKVTWMNGGDKTHTATSDLTVNGKSLFATGDIAQGTPSTPIEFTQAIYDAAVKATGTTPGERVHLGYFCAKHPTLMGGKIVLEPTGFKRGDKDDHE